MSALLKPVSSADLVLAKAVLNAADQLGLKQAELAAVLGVHRTAISRLKQKLSLDPGSKQGELALLLIRIARALYALTGGDKSWTQHFMHTPNQLSDGVPAQQVQSVHGLMQLLHVVDARPAAQADTAHRPYLI